MNNSFYEEFLLNNTPRLLTQVDRDPDSLTFGSCDRNYWHLKVRDFSSAILQQIALVLAIISKTQFKGNIYFNNLNINHLIYGILTFWKKIQLKDGSFNEYYPNEHAFPPTAFSLFAVSEAYRRLNLQDSSLLQAMEKSANYLSKNFEMKACNQEIASIAALYSYYLSSGQNWVLRPVKIKLTQILGLQSEEGWFPEYGGADLGYLSVSFDMLAEYFYLSKDENAIKPLEKILKFISYFCHPDRTFGGEYGSRNTFYLLPNGIETMAGIGCPLAFSIKNFIFTGRAHKNFHNSIDDRYFSHYVLHSFARSIEKEKLKETKNFIIEALPCQYEHFKFFPVSGLLTFRKKNIYGVISLKKGGLLKIFKNNNEIFSDYGYRYSEGKFIAATNWHDNEYSFQVRDLKNIHVEGFFNLLKIQVSSTLKHVVLRILSAIFGKIIISFLKKQLIFRSRHSKTKFSRNISINDSEILVEDKIFPNKFLKDFHSAYSYSFRHVASGNFFYPSELLTDGKFSLDYVKLPIRLVKKVNLSNKKATITNEEL